MRKFTCMSDLTDFIRKHSLDRFVILIIFYYLCNHDVKRVERHTLLYILNDK